MYFRCIARQPINIDGKTHALRKENRPREPGLYQCAEVIVLIRLITGGRIPTVKLKIPEHAFLKSESRTSVTFKL